MLTRNLNLRTLVPEDEELGGGPDDDAVDASAKFAELDGDGSSGAPAPETFDDGLDDLFAGDDESEDAATGDSAASAATSGTTRNPAVTSVLDKVREVLPQGLHSLIIDDHLAPELTKMQQGWDAEMAKIQPYRDLEKNGVTAEQAIEALRMAQFIANNPDQALKQIAVIVQQRGLSPAELLGLRAAESAGQLAPGTAAAAASAGAAADDTEAALRQLLGDDAANLDDNPALKVVLQQITELKRAQEQSTEARQRELEAAREREEQQAIDAAMARLEEGFKRRGVALNKQAVLQYAVAAVGSLPDGQRQGINPDEALKMGAAQWMKDVQEAAKQAQRRAPRVGGGRGGIGSAGVPARPAPPKTIQERLAQFNADMAAGKIVPADD